MHQLSLWEETEASEKPPPAPSAIQSHLIEVRYADGTRRILDTANERDWEAFRDMNVIYAGFVYENRKDEV